MMKEKQCAGGGIGRHRDGDLQLMIPKGHDRSQPKRTGSTLMQVRTLPCAFNNLGGNIENKI